MLAFAQKRLADATEAEDVAQDVFLALFRSIDRYEGRSSLLTWIFGIAHHEVCNRFRRRSVEAMVRATVDAFGRLDIAHNNAGIKGADLPVDEMPDDVWRAGISIMLDGVFYCMKHEIPEMRKVGGGAIVNTSSGAGLIGVPRFANYVAAKHGVIGLTKAAALEVIGDGIRVNAICPGTARSQMVDEWMDGSAEAEAAVASLHPIGRIAEAREIAEGAIWLASDAASFAVGTALTLDGGYTVP